MGSRVYQHWWLKGLWALEPLQVFCCLAGREGLSEEVSLGLNPGGVNLQAQGQTWG